MVIVLQQSWLSMIADHAHDSFSDLVQRLLQGQDPPGSISCQETPEQLLWPICLPHLPCLLQ